MVTTHAVITDEMIAKAKSRIGIEFTPREVWYNTQATKDTIRHFAHGIGDVNPLWLDEEYARKTKYGCILAPPCFLYSVYWATGRGAGLPGIHGWHSGTDWEFYSTIRSGDEFSVTNTLVDVVEKKSEMAGRSLIAYADTLYKNQKGETVAKARGWSVYAERGSSGKRGKYKEVPKATYTPEQLEAIYQDYDREEIRGSNHRYWEDVKVGDELTPIVKGPLSLRDIICWLMGAGSPYMKAHRLAVNFQKRHPAVGMIDTATGAVDVPELVHFENTRAGEIGVGGAYDYGPQRISWVGNVVTNWMGDDGFLKRFRAELRRFNVVGDTTWCKGKVIKKYKVDNEHLVDCEVWAENQRGEITAPGLATIVLPMRSNTK